MSKHSKTNPNHSRHGEVKLSSSAVRDHADSCQNLSAAGDVVANSMPMNHRTIRTEAFMYLPIQECRFERTPAQMLVNPVQDIGVGDAAETWISEIIASEDPDFEFENLINHLTGLLQNIKLVRKEYAKFTLRAA